MKAELQVVTSDGRKGQVASPLLQASAFRPVIVQFPEGDSKPYYLRELRIAEAEKTQPKPQG